MKWLRFCLVRVLIAVAAIGAILLAWVVLAPRPRDWDWHYRRARMELGAYS